LAFAGTGEIGLGACDGDACFAASACSSGAGAETRSEPDAGGFFAAWFHKRGAK
jgi:hypothetical protein